MAEARGVVMVRKPTAALLLALLLPACSTLQVAADWWKDQSAIPAQVEPTQPELAVEEYVFRAGHRVDREVDIRGGSVEFEVYVPESGRLDDWGKAEIIHLADGTGKVGNRFSLHPYKAKACVNASCKEPRYNLPWGTWRKVRAEWTPMTWTVAVDGVPVRSGLTTPWGPKVVASYGHMEHLLAGAKIRGIVWN